MVSHNTEERIVLSLLAQRKDDCCYSQDNFNYMYRDTLPLNFRDLEINLTGILNSNQHRFVSNVNDKKEKGKFIIAYLLNGRHFLLYNYFLNGRKLSWGI